MTLSVPTVYIVEITSPELRGGLAVIPNLFCQIGIFATYVAGRFLDWNTLALACEQVESAVSMRLVVKSNSCVR
jgi:hypothetical protein